VDAADPQDRLAKSAQAAALRWIGDPSVIECVMHLRPGMLRLVAPIDRHLKEDKDIAALVAKGLSVALFDRQDQPGPRADDWVMTEAEKVVLAHVAEHFVRLLRVAANRLAEDGVPLDPEAEHNIYALGYLVLSDYDGSQPAGKVVDGMAAWGLSRIGGDFRGVSHSDHASAGDRTDIDRLRAAQREQAGHPHIARTYAGGEKRALRSDTKRRREVLREVIEKFPTRHSASHLLKTWPDGPHTPGGYLRYRWGQLLGRDLLEQDAPSESALSEDLRAIRDEDGTRPE